MKKLFLLTVIMTTIASVSFGQAKKAILTETIKTPTLQCEDCKKRVEEYLKREPGVTKAIADFKRKTVKVTFYTNRTNIENIKTAIANAGFDADDVTANEDAYKRLPSCCKRTEDGGGKQ